MTTKYAKRPKNRPNGHSIYQHFPLQVPPKFTQIIICGFWKHAIWQPCVLCAKFSAVSEPSCSADVVSYQYENLWSNSTKPLLKGLFKNPCHDWEAISDLFIYYLFSHHETPQHLMSSHTWMVKFRYGWAMTPESYSQDYWIHWFRKE
jgi:hypothetical protein